MTLTVRATIMQTPQRGVLDVLDDQLVTVGDDGVITTVEPAAGREAEVVLPSSTVLLPGLIDTHVHAPQWPQLATGLDLPLDQWLFEHTFPLEARYADTAFARRVWASMVPRLVAGGTTTAVYYSSIHEEATTALAAECVARGQRAFVGRVAMDHPDETPAWYRDAGAAAAIEASHRSITAINALPGAGKRVRPILTPRFIPACSDALLEGLGELAAATAVAVQTHCSEGDWEHQHVLDRCGRTDTAALADFGLLRDHTVLAHATHLTDDDRRLIVSTGAGVSHCPLSNSYFANAVFPARRNLEAGLRVGLGTDIAGGPTASLLAQCAHAVTSSRMLEDGVDVNAEASSRGVGSSRIDVPTAFWMATVGGAEVLGLPAGLLAPGRVFDAVAVDTTRSSMFEGWPALDDWPRLFEKVVRGASATDITTVWVDGRDVTPLRR